MDPFSYTVFLCSISTAYYTVPLATRKRFSEILISCHLFHEPLDERNNIKM